VLLLTLVVAALTGTAMAEDREVETKNGTITLEGTLNADGTCDSWQVKSYTGSDTTLEIPAFYEGAPVKAIAKGAFLNSMGLYEVTIPSQIETVETNAFSNCTNLRSVTFLDCVEDGKYVKLSYITIKPYAFERCSHLNTVTLSGGVREIGKGAFEKCTDLTSIVIPEGVLTIGEVAFSTCASLQYVTFLGPYAALKDDSFSFANSNLLFHCPEGDTATFLKEKKAAFHVYKNSQEKLSGAAHPCLTGTVLVTFTCPGVDKVITTPVVDKDGKPVLDENGQPKINSTTKHENCTYFSNGKFSQTRQTSPSALHEEKPIDGVLPTCKDSGLSTGWRCSVCGTILEAQEARPADKNHTSLRYGGMKTKEVTVTLIDAACAKDGDGTEGWKVTADVCEGCGGDFTECETCKELKAQILAASDPVQKMNAKQNYVHHLMGDPIRPSYSGDPSITTHSHTGIARIDDVIGEIISPEHTWGEITWEKTKDPTCEHSGEETAKQVCEACGKEQSEEELKKELKADLITRKIDALGHDWKIVEEKVTKEATCAEEGIKTVTSECKNPKHVAPADDPADTPADDETSDETGNAADDETGGETSPAENDGPKVITEAKPIPKLPHTPEKSDQVIAPTCTTDGMKITYPTTCKVCHQKINEKDEPTKEIIPATGHKWGDPEPDPENKDKDKAPPAARPEWPM